jgi:hypothetical protein
VPGFAGSAVKGSSAPLTSFRVPRAPLAETVPVRVRPPALWLARRGRSSPWPSSSVKNHPVWVASASPRPQV